MAENRGDGSRLANVAATIKIVIKRLGFGHLLLWIAAALGQRFSIHVFVVTNRSIPDADPGDLGDLAAGLEARLLTCQEVARFFTREQGYSYQSAFAVDALARGDRCFGVLRGDQLLWYCWYARGPAPIFDDVYAAAEFPYLYVYNAHTDVAHRGRRLHPIGGLASGRFFAREGYRAFIAYIEATNLPPLIAARRMGERIVGFAVIRRTPRGARCFTTPGCRKSGFRLIHRSARLQPTPF